MMQLVTYYRVNLQTGITVEEVPSGWYRGSPELNRTVFKNLRRAKVAFTAMIRAETRRIQALQENNLRHLQELRETVGPMSNRRALKAHSFAPHKLESD